MLASIDQTSQSYGARDQGYAPAIVVSEHVSEKAYYLAGSDIKWIPCPNQTRGVGCVDCRLCFDSDRLEQQGLGIAFAVHGVRKDQVKRHLKVI